MTEAQEDSGFQRFLGVLTRRWCPVGQLVSDTGLRQDGRTDDPPPRGRRRIGCAHGRARRRHPPRHAAPADAARASRVPAPATTGWTLVDTGLGLPDAKERWAAELDGLPGGSRRSSSRTSTPTTSAARDLAELTGAPVAQGRLDYEQCELVWGRDDWPGVLVDWFHRHGVPEEETAELIEQARVPAVHPLPARSRAARPGRPVDRWEVVAAPGHADGQLMLLRDGVLVAADHLLDRISPTVGLWPQSSPDPLGDYLQALETTIALERRSPSPGTASRSTIPPEAPASCSRTMRPARRNRRGARTRATQRYDVSFPLFGDDLKPARRFAVAETLSHLERLVREGGARRHEDVGGVTYTPA